MANSDNKINIGDDWKSLDSMQINVSDSWKDVGEAYINIGDSWKVFYNSIQTLPSDKTLIGYWAGDENSGTVAVDSSGNGNNGTLVGATMGWTDGVSNKCFNFEAQTDYINLGVQGLTGDKTLSAWIWVDDNAWDVSPSTNYSVFEDENYKNYGFILRIGESNGKVYYRQSILDNSDSVTSTKVLTPQHWHHVAITYNLSTATAIIYIDGEEDIRETGFIDNLVSTDIFTLGANSQGFKGKIDEGRVYNSVLTATEIKALYLHPGGFNIVKDGLVFNTGNDNFSFNGTSEYLEYPDDGTSIDNEFTVIAWVKASSISSLMSIFKKNTTNDGWPIISLNVDSNGALHGYYSAEVYGYCLEGAYSNNGTILVDNWYQVAFSKGTSGYTSMKLYVNGSSITYSNYLYGSHINTIANSTKPIHIGVGLDSGTYSQYWNGLMYTVKLYNRQLTDNEITQDFDTFREIVGI